MQTFLYKLLCDKFAYEMKRLDPKLAGAGDWIAAWQKLSKAKRQDLADGLGADVPSLTADQLIPSLFHRQSEPGFAKLFARSIVERHLLVYGIAEIPGSRLSRSFACTTQPTVESRSGLAASA